MLITKTLLTATFVHFVQMRRFLAESNKRIAGFARAVRLSILVKWKIKQGLVQDYSQRIEGANIYRQKLSRLKLFRLRPIGQGSLGWGPWAKAL